MPLRKPSSSTASVTWAFLLGIFLIYLTFNSVQYGEVFQKASLGQFGNYGA